MHVVIMGCGRVGAALAAGLASRGHDVAVIDADPDAFRRLGPRFDGLTIIGKGFDRDVLLNAGIERADAFAAVSSGDNSNIIAARVAREQFGVRNVVARIYDAGRAEVYERLGIPTIATVTWAADQVLRRILPAEAEPIGRDPSGRLRIDRILARDEWVGRRVDDVERSTGARVAYLTRYAAGTMVDGATVVQEGDVLSVVLPERVDALARPSDAATNTPSPGSSR